MKEKITEWLIKRDAIGEEDRELYEFALENLFLVSSPFLLAVVFSITQGVLLEEFLFILGFLLTRSYTGGYHISSSIICMVCSTLVLCLAAIIIRSDVDEVILLTPSLVNCFLIWSVSPIDNEDRPLTPFERLKYRRVSRLILASLLLVYGLTAMIGYNRGCLVIEMLFLLIGTTQVASLLE